MITISKKKKVPIIYIFIYNLMKEEAGNHLFISYSKIREILKRRFNRIPTIYFKLILKEMVELGLIESAYNDKYKTNLLYKFKYPKINVNNFLF